MRAVYKAISGLTPVILILALNSVASDFYMTFDGPYLKSAPGKASIQYTQNNVTTFGYAAFTADWTTGKVGNQCFVFNGDAYDDWYWNNAWARVDNHPTVDIGLEDFSIEFWVKTSETKGNNTILDKRLSGTGYHVTLENGNLLLQLATSSLGYVNYTSSSARVNDGFWHKVQISVERTKTDGGRFFIDGRCVYTFNPTRFASASLSNTEALWIGRHIVWVSAYFNGSLDDLRIWKK